MRISLLVGDQQAPNLNRIFGYSRNSERHIGYLHWISIMVGNVHIIKHHQHNPVLPMEICHTRNIMTLITLLHQMTTITILTEQNNLA